MAPLGSPPPWLSPFTGVLPLAVQPEFVVKPFWCKSQFCVALQTSQYPSPKLCCCVGAFAGRACLHVRGRRCWEHALKASNLFIFTLLRGNHSPMTGQRTGGSCAGSKEINLWGTGCFGRSGLSLTSNSLCLCEMKWDKSSRKPPPILLSHSSLG